MKLFHCTECHHEWEGGGTPITPCDWCGAPGKEIATVAWPTTQQIKEALAKLRGPRVALAAAPGHDVKSASPVTR